MEVVLVVVIVALAVIGWLLPRRRTRPEPGRWEPKSKQPRPRAPETLPASFVVADTETNGLSPDRHHIIEIAAVRVIGGLHHDGSHLSCGCCRGRLARAALEWEGAVTGDWIFCGRKNYEQSNAMLLLSLYQELGASGGRNDQIANFDRVPPDWRCPCCLRQKRAIARLNKRGELWCQIDHVLDGVYADNMCSSLWAARDELYAKLGWTGLIIDPRNPENQALDGFLRRFSRFDALLICANCNTADSAAKRLVGAPIYFTFAPFEIAKFVRSKFREPHDIVQERAMEIYKWAGPQVEDTVARARVEITAFIDQVVAASRAATRHEPTARQERRR